MEPEIVILKEQKLYGLALDMSLVQNTTHQLFQDLMTIRSQKELHPIPVFDIKIYPDNYFEAFNPNQIFTKWVAIDLTSTADQEQLHPIHLPAGKYAKFSNPYEFGNPQIYQDILQKWLPNSNFQLDNRPHFDVFLPQKDRAHIKEEIYIPIKD